MPSSPATNGIHSFMRLARALIDTSAASAERAEAAEEVRRYFAEALPLHHDDEEHSIAPRLRGRDAALDQILATMHAQHAALDPLTVALVTACTQRVRQPDGAHDDVSFRALLDALDAQWDQHLALEEGHIVPALRSLPEDVTMAIRSEMRARRAPAQK